MTNEHTRAETFKLAVDFFYDLTIILIGVGAVPLMLIMIAYMLVMKVPESITHKGLTIKYIPLYLLAFHAYISLNVIEYVFTSLRNSSLM